MASDKEIQALISVREKLMVDIEQTLRLFGPGPEISTCRSALKCIDEMIEQMQQELYGDSRFSETEAEQADRVGEG